MKGKVKLIQWYDCWTVGQICFSKDPIGNYKLGKFTTIKDYKRDQCVIEDYFNSGSSWGTAISDLRTIIVEGKEWSGILNYSEWPSAVKRGLMWNNKTIHFEVEYPPEIPETNPLHKSLNKFRLKLGSAKFLRKKMYSQKQVNKIISELVLK